MRLKLPPEQASKHKCFPALGKPIKVLMVWPRFPSSFWGFQKMLGLMPEETPLPPLGLITVAALCPKEWTIRLIDRAFEDLLDADLLWADLVMVSAMQVQKDDVREILGRARALGKRTIIGGPYASSEPEALLPLADHVVVGEPDEVFQQIAADLEAGTARRLYTIQQKPDTRRTPVPRFDLLKIENYLSMSVQFSRGCPFQCEFCDIITIYGRKPRTKRPSQITAELDALFDLGWRKPIFMVDDNFIGNHKLAFELVQELEQWQKRHGYPFAFWTEASIDLAQRPALIEAMVRANFLAVFVGIESPSRESLREIKKFQNLRQELLDCIRFLQERGLWVMGGFIIGFDSDTEDIFERQVEFIQRAAIPWAMAGFLQVLPTTPLYDRMLKEGRLIEQSVGNNFVPPNFRTVLPSDVLLAGMQKTFLSLYSPSSFYRRAFLSLLHWNPSKHQRAPRYSITYKLGVVLRSVWHQGIRSSYRKAYWKFLLQLVWRWFFRPQKLWLGFTLLLSAQHFVDYAAEVAAQLERELQKGEKRTTRPSLVWPGDTGKRADHAAATVNVVPN
jgi:radical SAM superfamily enzyme YgiQ (UPF0313 family)